MFFPFEMFTHHFLESLEENLHRLLVFSVFFFFYFMNNFFDMIRDIMRIFGSFEDEIIIISSRIENNISFMKERIPEGMSLNLGSFYIMIIYIDNMSGKNIPVNIYNSEIGYNPYIIIPVKYLVNKKEIE